MIAAFIKRHLPRVRLFPWLALMTVVVLAGVTMMPALLRHDSALQIRASRQGGSLPDGFYVYQTLSGQGIHIKSITPEQDSLVIRFDSQEQSDAAAMVLRELFPQGFDIAHQQIKGGHWLSRVSLRPPSVN